MLFWRTEQMKKLTIVAVLSAFVLSACVATGPGVNDMAIGDDSIAINQGRNRAEAQVSRAQLEQHRRQRANASEEMDLAEKKRQSKHAALRDNMGTALGGAVTVLGVVGAAKAVGSMF
ncbi:MAG: hypothetical protein IJM09_05430 [Neisseriaceae bacterium]|nr:hypothetical protein [Neisseriaceae bacterium]